MLKNSLIESHCPKKGYHNFRIVINNYEVIVDVCQKCGKKIIYNKKDGKIDDKKYMRYNFRKLLQPEVGTQMGEDYNFEYGKIKKC